MGTLTSTDGRVVAGGAQKCRSRYPLSSLLRCGNCRRSLTGVSNGYSRYYRCRTRAADRSCAAPFVRADVAEGAFADWIGALVLPPDWREAIAGTHNPSIPAEDRRDRLTERLARLRKLYAWGEIPEAEYRSEAQRVHAELAEVAEPSPSSMEAVAAALADLGRTWAAASAERKSAVARLMLREMVVRDGQVVAFMARAELRPLLDLCVAQEYGPYADKGCYIAETRYAA